MLSQIIETKLDEIESLTLPAAIDVKKKSLFHSLQASNRELALIAEVKKASPSKGIIKENFQPIEIAKGYERGGADAISVLTDVQYFQGHRDYLTAIKQNVTLPILRKDFIISELQIEESVLIGADAILLIAAVFEPKRLKELYDLAYSYGLECLVEVHSQKELEEMLALFTPQMIGVNNRNLKTFETSLQQTEDISQYIPKESLFISESGIHTFADTERVKRAGANGVLVGESLMRAKTPEHGIVELLGDVNVESKA
ncbi:indole-3-glycerol phosphate synthase TrpC [Alkalihalobacillus sp. LMS39]|uniref:indole-3-glycerol phosphate synthase TrpC n=1 Tax=Alkalihalobacillus sp. LMS39 TaxID=2924032 RepID=UPI001FB336FC|nr:indole-3-glycerol phosphate synthase TrpC [Alkalihalobacillus sp. LMS39]UOE92335.1 indole-3-glycerol phosphate synthase TrpC [Alkalihalobacillus sp. LMS39]